MMAGERNETEAMNAELVAYLDDALAPAERAAVAARLAADPALRARLDRLGAGGLPSTEGFALLLAAAPDARLSAILAEAAAEGGATVAGRGPWRRLAAAAAVLILGWFGTRLWQQIAAPTRELAQLQSRIHEVEDQAKTYEKVTAQADIIEHWEATDVNWLDELEQTAKRVRPKPVTAKDFPAASDTMLTHLRIIRPTGVDAAGGRLDLQGVAKNSAAVKDLEDRLGGENRRVIPGLGKTDKAIPGYDWSYQLEVRVPRTEEESAEADQP